MTVSNCWRRGKLQVAKEAEYLQRLQELDTVRHGAARLADSLGRKLPPLPALDVLQVSSKAESSASLKARAYL